MTLQNAHIAAEGPDFIIDAAGQDGPTHVATAVLSDGRIAVVWQEATGRLGDLSGSEIVAKVLNVDASVAVQDFRINTTTAGDQTLPSISSLGIGGEFVVAWQSQAANGGATDTRFQVLGSDGHSIGGETVASGQPSTLAGLSNANFILGGGIYAGTTQVATQQSIVEPNGENNFYAGYGKVIAESNGQFANLETGSDAFSNFTLLLATYKNDGTAVGNPVQLEDIYYRSGEISDYFGAYLSTGILLTAAVISGDGEFNNDVSVTDLFVGGSRVTTLDGDQVEAMTAMGDGTAAIVWKDTNGAQHLGAVNAAGNVQEATGAIIPADATDLSLAFGITGRLLLTFTDDAGKIEGQTFDTAYFTPVLPPTITGTTARQSVNDNASDKPFSHVTISDPNDGVSSLTVTVTLDAAAKGTLINLGGGSYDAATGTYSITGSAAAVTAALDNLVFAPTANRVAPGTAETTVFTITANDGVGPVASDSSTNVRSVSINDAPTVAGAVAGQTTSDNQPDHPFAAVTVGDADNPPQTLTVTVRLSDAANGALAGPTGSYDASSGTYTVSGTAAAVTAALRALTFTPTFHQVAPGSAVTTTFTIGANDGKAATVFNDTASVTVTGTSTPPSLTFTSVTVGPNGQLTFGGTITKHSGASVVLTNNGTTIGNAATIDDAAGTWSLTLVPPAGVYKYPTAVATDPFGNYVTASPAFAFVAGITGQPYTTIVNTLDATGATVASKAYNQNGSLYRGLVVTHPSGRTVYTYSGGSYFADKNYDRYANTFDSGNNLLSTVTFDVTGQPYSSSENDYDPSTHKLTAQKFFGFKNLPYTSTLLTYAVSGAQTGLVQYKGSAVYLADRIATTGGVTANLFYAGSALAGEPYTSYEYDYRGGKLIEQQYFGFKNQPYTAYAYLLDSLGGIASQTTTYTDGSHAMKGFEDGVTLASLHNDTMTGGGAKETFLFGTGYGHDVITDFYKRLDGALHDTVSLARSEFANFASMLAHTQTVGGNAVITGAGSDQITLLGMTRDVVAAHQADFIFHA